MITELEPHQILVVGTNARGNHAGGAAAMAHKAFGALMGEAEGAIGGQSYGIVTLDENMRRVSLGYILEQAQRLWFVAWRNPSYEFLLTPVGTGIAGFSIDEIWPLFSAMPSNVIKVGWPSGGGASL